MKQVVKNAKKAWAPDGESVQASTQTLNERALRSSKFCRKRITMTYTNFCSKRMLEIYRILANDGLVLKEF